jgi:hypothetical protein
MHVLVIALLILWWSWPIGLAVFALLIFMSRGRSWHRRKDRAHRKGRGLASSGNVAFDEYRQAALQQLHEERAKFAEFLERLRKSKDAADFNRFMADRRGQRNSGDTQGAGA